MAIISESEFYMWRTLFAMTHADDVVTDEEVRFMAEILEDVHFSEEQKVILNQDVKNPADIIEMFKKIEDQKDQARFFKFARDLVWADGDYAPEEQEMMLKLITQHTQGVNLDELVGHVEMEFDDGQDSGSATERPMHKSRKTLIQSFRDQFFRS